MADARGEFAECLVQPTDVASYYDEWTQHYVNAFGSCIQAHRPSDDTEFLEYLSQRIGLVPNMRVLDAGCGICGPARYFARNSKVVIDGITISAVQRNLAIRANDEASLAQQISVKLGDFHHLSAYYPPNSFDAAYFLESLSHASDPVRVASSVHDVLKKGSCVYVKDFFIRPCKDEQDQQDVLDVVSRVNQLFAVNTRWAVEIIDLFERTGFALVFADVPGFSNDSSRWYVFQKEHKLDLYNGRPEFCWSEWWEMKFKKL